VCGPQKRALVTARLCLAYRSLEGSKNRLKLVTLTFDHDVDRAFVLLSLQHLAQTMRRKYGTFSYARFPERTKRGRIHLHLVVSCPFIPPKELKEAWRVASKGSYIVDIRTIHAMEKLAGYVAKDLTKALVGRVTWSRCFPNFPETDQLDPSHDDPEKFTYRYFDIPHALAASGGSESLWTGESVYPNGPCECWKHPNPDPEGIPYRLHEPLPETDERAPPCGLRS